jgi:hypothetical protein
MKIADYQRAAYDRLARAIDLRFDGAATRLNAPSTRTSPASLEELAALVKRLPLPPRSVFFFDGVRRDLVGLLIDHGVSMAGGVAMLGEMEIYEIDGRCWVAANRRDVEDARARRLRVKVIGKFPPGAIGHQPVGESRTSLL